jgi:hypothetical protein
VKKSSQRSRFVPVELGKVDGTRVVLEAVDHEMTAFGGVPMLAKVEQKVGLVKELSRRVNDPRAQHMVDHEGFDIMLQRACQIGAGYADGNDCDWLRADAGIMLGLERDPGQGRAGASQETTCRFESKAVDRLNAKAVRELFVDHFIARQKGRPKEVVLDPDGTMMKTYGAQEGSVYRGGHYSHTMYFPLKIMCGEWLMATVLRRGDQSESRTILGELKMVVGKLRDKWTGLRIKVRLDAAFGSPALYQWLRKERVEYEIALRSNSVLELNAKAYMKEAEAQFRRDHGEPRFTGRDGKKAGQAEHARIRGLPTDQRMQEEESWRRRRTRVVGEFSYKPEKWKHWERVICRVDFTDKGVEVHYVMVSWQYGVPQRIYEEDYCRRGFAEQCIGRFKQVAHKLSAQQFLTNQFRLVMYGVALVLLLHLREFAPTSLRRADVNTLRKVLMLMPMVIRRTATKLVLQISQSHAHCKTFLSTWRRLSTA